MRVERGSFAGGTPCNLERQLPRMKGCEAGCGRGWGVVFGGARVTVAAALILAFLTECVTPTDLTGMIILPKTLKPQHYEVRLQPFLGTNFSVEGRVDVEFLVLMPTHHVILHMADIVTKNESTKVISKESGEEFPILQQRYEHPRSLYVAQLGKQLEAGKSYVLTMEFTGTLGEQARGFYRSSYVKENGEKSWVASTQFQSTDARRAFPCFDEPGLKATFKIYLAREEHMRALSNMPVVTSAPIEGQPGWVWDEFDKSVPMSTYLIAFAISDFTPRVINEGSNDTMIRVWTQGSSQDRINYGARVTKKGLQFFEDFFQVEFPLPKLDMICPPEMSPNAMENWGLVTFRESGMLYDPVASSADQKQWVCYLVAHELAHQWFGNLVTLSWWTDLWLNEGFATYMGDTAVDYVEPSWGTLDQFVVRRLQNVMGLDALRSSHPVSVPVNDPAEINEIFDSISYNKGASIIRMMKYFLTEATFRKGLKNYLTDLKYKNADQDDLWRFLTEAAHEDRTLSGDLSVKTIMDTWTLRKGFPVITVSRAGNSSAIITQEYFLLDRNTTAGDNYKWWIPVTYTSQENPSFHDTGIKFWLNDRGIEPVSFIGFPQINSWVIFNVQQTGYYRVNYDEDNWNLLVKQLQNNHEIIHDTNRAQIIDDALNLARAGRLSYDIALEVTSYLNKEQNYVPWKAALNNFQYLHDMFRHDPSYGAFKEYMLSVIVPLYNLVGFDEVETEALQTQLLRVEAVQWACRLGHKDCIQRSIDLFKMCMNSSDNFKLISSNTAATVYCTAVRYGGEAEWKFAWETARNATSTALKSSLTSALACTDKVWLIARYLDGTFNSRSGIRRQNAAGTYSAISGHTVGSILAWDYLREHWQHIRDYIGATFFALPKMIQAVTKSFNTHQLLRELQQFQTDHEGNLLTATRAVKQAVESTRLNVAWMEENYSTIVEWLRRRGYSSAL